MRFSQMVGNIILEMPALSVLPKACNTVVTNEYLIVVILWDFGEVCDVISHQQPR